MCLITVTLGIFGPTEHSGVSLVVGMLQASKNGAHVLFEVWHLLRCSSFHYRSIFRQNLL